MRIEATGAAVVPFPTGYAEGNDDPRSDPTDEDNNPYRAYSGDTPALGHAFGEISSFDGPFLSRKTSDGTTDGEIYFKQASFREFARVQLWDGKRSGGRFWFRISDYTLWHHFFRAKFHKRLILPNYWEATLIPTSI